MIIVSSFAGYRLSDHCVTYAIDELRSIQSRYCVISIQFKLPWVVQFNSLNFPLFISIQSTLQVADCTNLVSINLRIDLYRGLTILHPPDWSRISTFPKLQETATISWTYNHLTNWKFNNRMKRFNVFESFNISSCRTKNMPIIYNSGEKIITFCPTTADIR